MLRSEDLDTPFQKQDPVFYAGDELHRIKRDKIERAMEQASYDALLLFKAEAVRYVTDFYVKGFRPFMEPEYLVLVPRGKPPAVGHTSGSDDLRIRFKSDIEDHRRLPEVSRWSDVLGEMIADYGLQNARIGTDLMPFTVHQALTEAYPKVSFEDASAIWVDVTAIKHPLEIELIRDSVTVADLGVRAAAAAIRPGIREFEVAAEAEYAMRRNGSEMTPFIPCIASGSNASMFERVATEKTIEDGEMVIMDIGCVVKGYTGDLGRTVVCGAPTATQKEIYRVAYDSVREAAKCVRPGMTCHAVDRRAREVIEDAGWGKYQHAGNTGHQLGYGLHGEPLIHRDVDVPLVENMVICLEPRVVLPDQPAIGGAHLEDVLVVTEDGAEYLNDTPYDERLLS